MQDSEAKIIKACQRYELQAQRALYERYVDRLYYVVGRYVRDSYFIENILQDIFLKVFKHIERFDPKKGQFSSWIKTIAIRESINFCQKKRIVFYSISDVPECEKVASVNPALSKMTADEILEVIAAIPDKYRLIFNLSEIDGYSHKEIGQILQINESTSRSYLTRARKMIKKRLNCCEVPKI